MMDQMVDQEEKQHCQNQYPVITAEDFEQIDMGTYECRTTGMIWEYKTDIVIICWEAYAGYGYDDRAVTQYATESNLCLRWIEEKKEYIEKIISENSKFQLEYGFEVEEKNFLDRSYLKKIQIEINVLDGKREVTACMVIEAAPFFFYGHCHCIRVAVWAQEDGTYQADLIEDVQQILSEISDALKEKNAEACKWAKKHGIFYVFDDEGNMLAVAKQDFGVSIDGKLIAETDSGDLVNRNALYFIRENWGREAVPLPLGFVIKELIFEDGVFIMMLSTGHKIVLGTFFGMQEVLTVIEMLYHTRGVTEEEIDNCYNSFRIL